MVLLMESLSTPRGASGSRRTSPLFFHGRYHMERAGNTKPRTPTIAEEDCCAARDAVACADENAAPECSAQAWHSPACTPPSASATCTPGASPLLPSAPCSASPAALPRAPLSPLPNGMDTLALVGATPRPFAAAAERLQDFSFGVGADVDLSSPLPSFAMRDCNEVSLTPFASPVGAEELGASPAADAAGCYTVAFVDPSAESPTVKAASRRLSTTTDSLMSPAVHCAATAAALCESVVLIGLCLFEETAALALPRVRSVGRAAAERAGSLAVQVQSALDDAQAAVDGKRCSAWLRAALKSMETEGAKDEFRRACSKDAALRDKLALSHTDLAMLLR